MNPTAKVLVGTLVLAIVGTGALAVRMSHVHFQVSYTFTFGEMPIDPRAFAEAAIERANALAQTKIADVVPGAALVAPNLALLPIPLPSRKPKP